MHITWCHMHVHVISIMVHTYACTCTCTLMLSLYTAHHKHRLPPLNSTSCMSPWCALYACLLCSLWPWPTTHSGSSQPREVSCCRHDSVHSCSVPVISCFNHSLIGAALQPSLHQLCSTLVQHLVDNHLFTYLHVSLQLTWRLVSSSDVTITHNVHVHVENEYAKVVRCSYN